MDRDQLNNGAQSSEPIRGLPAYQYIMPKEEDGLEPESNVADREALGGEHGSTSAAQDHVVPRSQEGQDSAVALPIRQILDHEHGRVAIASAQNPILQSVKVTSCSYGSPSDGSGKQSRELSRTVGRSESQQPQSRKVDGSLEDNGLEGNVAQNGESSARHSPSADDKRVDGAEVGGPVQHLEGDQHVLDQVSRNDAAGTTFNTLPPLWSVLPQFQTDTLPLLEPGMSTFGPSRNDEQIRPPISNTILPSTAEFDANVHRWGWRPRYQWTGFLPPEYETRRFERRTVDNKLVLFHGPTHMGPPFKPLDGPRAEEVAIERWRRTMRDREIREGRVL